MAGSAGHTGAWGWAGLFGGLWAAGFVGRAVMRPLAKASPNAVTVASIGVLIALTESARLAAGTRQLWLPPLLSQPVRFWSDGGFAVTLTPMQMLNTAAFGLLVLSGSVYLGCSAFGRRWKAVSDDPLAASFCGVNAGRVFLLSYCAAGLVAAIAGVLATFYYGTMDFGAGLVFGLKIVLISAAGGYASPLICRPGGRCGGICGNSMGRLWPNCLARCGGTGASGRLADRHAQQGGSALRHFREKRTPVFRSETSEKAMDYRHLSFAASSVVLADTQSRAAPSLPCSFFQNGAEVFR